jgi:chromosome segregation ATPase
MDVDCLIRRIYPRKIIGACGYFANPGMRENKMSGECSGGDPEREDMPTLLKHIAGLVEATNTDVGALRTSFESRIGGLEGRMSNMENRMGSMENRMVTMESRMSSMDTRVGSIEGRLGGIDGRLSGVERRLIGVEGRLSGVEDRLGGVEERLEPALVDLHAIRETCNGLKSLFGTFDDRHRQLQLRVEVLETEAGFGR